MNKKEYMKEYQQRPEVKKRRRKNAKKYGQSPKAKACQKAYRQRPEVKTKQKEYMKKYNKEYILKNRENLKKQKKEYYENNKEGLLRKQKKYNNRPKVKQKRKERKREWYLQNREGLLKKRKKDYQNNRERKLEYAKIYYQIPKNKKKRKEYIKNYRKDYEEKKYITDENFRIKKIMRSYFRRALRVYSKSGKIYSSKQYGISFIEIIEHLKPFPKDLSKYHIDHIKPLCSFNLENPKEVKKAFAPENHQWLTIQENLSKGGKIIYAK